MSQTVDLTLATRASDPDAVPGLIEEINALQSSSKEGDEETRHKLVIKTRSLLQSLLTPREQMLQHTWADPGLNAALITGVDVGLWKLMVKNGVDTPQKVEDLAKPLGMDPVLLGRLLRHVCAMGHLEEVAQDEYKLSNFAKSLSLDVIGDGYVALLGGIGRSPIEFYKFLRDTKWQNPTDAAHTAMHASYNTDLPNCFEYLRSIGLGPHTNHHMGGYRQGRLPWMHPTLYPVEQTLIAGADTSPDAPLVVDVAGGLGHDINEFKKFYPNHPGKLILQDLPVVIQDVKDIDSEIQLMSHDFLTEQPVKGARAYFMHSILHDWPDDICKTILSRLADAMKPGYSKLLIFECVIPRTGAYWEATAGDILMMTQLSALERTEDHWRQLIEGSGLNLKIVKFWTSGQSDVENVIECELA
ncbi:S-adenosyl-L-methionine-dependent methyltransferase [Coniochaeta sp. PMI_546]|nr:S-adenosyl-L-methionine-dependent methyltransferase [Coniochaeta sp. PMI_546]